MYNLNMSCRACGKKACGEASAQHFILAESYPGKPLQNRRSGFRQKAAFSGLREFAAFFRDAATVGGAFYRSLGSSISLKRFLHRAVGAVLLAGLSGLAINQARGEGMLELFQTPWSEITQKMPEIAEAGYDSLWLPNPAKGNSGGFSVGYDHV